MKKFFSIGSYGIVFRIQNGFISANSPEFGLTITKRLDSVRKLEDIGMLYFSLIERISDDVKGRQKRKEKIPTPKESIDLVPKAEPSNLKITDVARMLEMSVDTVRRLTESGKLKSRKTPGGHRRYRVSDVAKWRK